MTEAHNPINTEQTPLIEHFRELRNRVMIIVLTIIIGFSATCWFAQDVYQFLVAPLADAMGGDNRRLIYTGLTETFFTYIKLSFFSAFCVTFPIITYQIYAFIAPALYKNERGFILPLLFLSPVLFIIGAALAYYFIFPMAWEFFLGFENIGSDGDIPIQLEARVSEYLSLVINIILAFGIAFQMPIVLILLVNSGFITAETLRKKRKYALIGILILAAIATPPDVISQIGLALPLLLLYEFSIIICSRLSKSKE